MFVIGIAGGNGWGGKGVSLYSDPPRYYYTKLDDLKIEMISRATENARIRAENIAKNSGAARSTGLGLTFCKLAVEAHGGKIWAESPQDEGAIFYFTLPLS